MINFLKRHHLIHSWEIIKWETTKHISFGLSGTEMPGQRCTEKCKVCGKEQITSVNLWMPKEYLKKQYNNLWS